MCLYLSCLRPVVLNLFPLVGQMGSGQSIDGLDVASGPDLAPGVGSAEPCLAMWWQLGSRGRGYGLAPIQLNWVWWGGKSMAWPQPGGAERRGCSLAWIWLCWQSEDRNLVVGKGGHCSPAAKFLIQWGALVARCNGCGLEVEHPCP